MAYVVVFARGAPPQRFSLSGPAIIGRALGCDIWLDDPELSRKHCTIEPLDDRRWALRDLDSSNGTFLQRDQVKTHVLQDGDAIYIGSTRIHFHADRPLTSHRPSNPNEASCAPGQEAKDIPVPPGPRRRGARPTSVPRKHGRAVSLPFSRPPAKPIVGKAQSSDDPGVSSSWFSTVVNRLRRGGSDGQ